MGSIKPRLGPYPPPWAFKTACKGSWRGNCTESCQQMQTSSRACRKEGEERVKQVNDTGKQLMRYFTRPSPRSRLWMLTIQGKQLMRYCTRLSPRPRLSMSMTKIQKPGKNNAAVMTRKQYMLKLKQLNLNIYLRKLFCNLLLRNIWLIMMTEWGFTLICWILMCSKQLFFSSVCSSLKGVKACFCFENLIWY